MFKYSISRKQCGVLFAAIKRGELVVEDGFTSWMYNEIADAKCYEDNSALADIFDRMHSAINSFFAGNKEECNETINSAFSIYTAKYSK